MKYRITVREQSFEVQVESLAGGTARVTVDQVPYVVQVERLAVAPALNPGSPPPVAAVAPAAAVPPAPPAAAAAGGIVSAPIPGVITALKVAVGDAVAAGQVVATMEAMKMENNLVSHREGRVREIRVQKGSEVATGDVVMVIA